MVSHDGVGNWLICWCCDFWKDARMKNPFFGDEFVEDEGSVDGGGIVGASSEGVESSGVKSGGGPRLPRKALPGKRQVVLPPSGGSSGGAGQGGRPVARLVPSRGAVPSGGGVGGSSSVPVSPSSGSSVPVPSSGEGVGVPSGRKRPQVVLPPSSGVKRSFVRDDERVKLGPRPVGVRLPSSGSSAPVPSPVSSPGVGESSVGESSSVPSSGEGASGEGSVVLSGKRGGVRLPSRGRGSVVLPVSGEGVSSEGVPSAPVPSAHVSPSPVSPSSVPSSGVGGKGLSEWEDDFEFGVSVVPSPGVGESSVEGSSSGVGESSVGAGARIGQKKRRKEKSAPSPRVEALATVGEDWDDEDEVVVDDAAAYRESVVATSASRGVRLMERDIRIFDFLGRYGYAQDSQIARLIGTSDRAAYIRLSKLDGAGLIKKYVVARGHTIWVPLRGAMAIAELDMPVKSASRISLATMGHELGLGNLGVELEIGGHNVLSEEGWPFYNRYADTSDFNGDDVVLGENVFTTREIRSAQTRWNKGKSSAQLMAERDELLRLWVPGERSPETLPENAGMFVLYSNDYKDHVPDMVVARDRDMDGSARSLAIELELNVKPLDEWRRILKNYRDHIGNGMFHSLYYFTQRRAIKDSLQKLNANEIGIPEERFKVLKYVPNNGGQLIFG